MNPASDYERSFPARPQPLTLQRAARIAPPAQAVDTEGMIDVPRMRAYRQIRLREQTAVQGLDALILVEPLSIRYATGVRNCALFQMHIQAGYLFLPADGPVVYYPVDAEFDYDGALEPGMVMCVESHVGEIGGAEGVKLENQCLITESGPIVLSRYPFEDDLLIREL